MHVYIYIYIDIYIYIYIERERERLIQPAGYTIPPGSQAGPLFRLAALPLQ